MGAVPVDGFPRGFPCAKIGKPPALEPQSRVRYEHESLVFALDAMTDAIDECKM